MHSLRAAFPILLLAASFLIPTLPGQAVAAGAPTRPEVLDWLDGQAAYYAQHPELVGKSGTGWKQYARAKHFYESRLTPEGTLPTMQELLRLRAEHDAKLQIASKVGGQYFELGPTNLGARVVDIEFDPNVPGRIYAATAGGGLVRSTDAGATWTMFSDQLASLSTSAISVDPSDSDKLIVATSDKPSVGIGLGIFYSSDAGVTWTASDLFASTPWISIHDLEVGPNGQVHIASTDQGIYRSINDGVNWSLVQSGGEYYDAVIANPLMFAVKRNSGANDGGIYRSTDGGVNWSLSGTGQPTPANVGKSRLAVSGGTVFALIGDRINDGLYGLWTSSDGGDSWSQMPNGPETVLNNKGEQAVGGQVQSGFNLAFAVDPSNANNIFVGAQFALLSTDGGLNWTTQEQSGPNNTKIPHVDYHAAKFRPGAIWVGTDGGMFRSTDLGANYTDQNVGIGCFLSNSVAVAQSDIEVMFSGAQDNRNSQLLTATDWQLVTGMTGDGAICVVDPVNPLNVYVDTQNGHHYRSTDGGANFSEALTGIGDTSNGDFVNDLVIDPSTPSTLYAPTNSDCSCGAGLWRTTDGMQNWTQVDTGRPRVIGVSKVSSNTVWTVRNNFNQLRVTTDWWTTFTDYTLPFTPGAAAEDIETVPGSDGVALICYGGYSTGGLHVVRATQYGAVITDVTGDLPDVPANALAIDPQDPTHWYVATDLGVYRSTNIGVNWVPFGTGLPNAIVTDLAIHDGARKLIVSTYGRGSWLTNLPGATAAPSELAEPSNLMFDSPYPSPATDRTILRFAAKQASANATLDIYDAAGRHVDSVAEFRADGVVRSIAWVPGNRAAGIYYAVLRAGADRVTRKIVVAK